MAALVQFSKLNTFRFVAYQAQWPDKYHSIPFETGLFAERGNDRVGTEPFLQPVEMDDPWGMEFDAYNTTSTRILSLIDCNGFEYGAWSPTATTTVPGRLIAGTSINPGTFFYQNRFSTIGGLPEGQYYLMLQLFDDTATELLYISEPLFIAASHPDTVLIEYRHRDNTRDFVFTYDTINARLCLRVGGGMNTYRPESADTFYRDQEYTTQLVSSTPYSSKTFYAGYSLGMADWYLDKLNRIFSCSNVRVDGEQLVKAEGAKWEVSEVDQYHLLWASISVEPAKNRGVTVFNNVSALTIFARPAGGFPYAIHSARISGDSPAYNLINGAVLNNSTQEAALAAQVQGTLGLFGTWSYNSVTGLLTYLPDLDESYYAVDTVTLTKILNITKRIQPLSRLTQFEYSGFQTVWDWDEGTPEAYGVNLLTYSQPTHDYTGGLGVDKVIRVFHADTMETFSSFHTDVRSAGGIVPSTLTVFTMQGSKLSAFNCNVLTPALAVLAVLDLSNTRTLGVITNLAQAWVVLKELDFNNCGLISSEVDNVFNNFVSTAPAASLTSGRFYTQAQFPTAAPPTGASLASRLSLITLMWDVQTD